jgi:hypothetical protein
MTLSITILNIYEGNVITLSISALSTNDTLHNGAQHSDTQYNGKNQNYTQYNGTQHNNTQYCVLN